jgi:O-antigen/teichoic acid export membrane protein
VTLRTKALRGGFVLAGRQGIGMVLSLVSLLFVTRVIGPTNYGVYVAAAGIQTYLVSLGLLGLNVYLIRSETAPSVKEYSVAATLLVATGLGWALLVFLLLPTLETTFRLPNIGAVLPLLLLALPIQLLNIIPVAQMERDLNYERIAMAELVIQFVNMLVALVLAWRGFGAVAPAFAVLVSQVVGLPLLLWLSSLRLRPAWDLGLIRQMLSYGFAYAASNWVWQLRQLVNPLIVARFLGAEAVGIIALAIRFVDLLSFAKGATYRIALSALAKMQGNTQRVRNAVTEGAGLQVLAVGPLLVGFAVIAPFILPRFFGTAWETSMTIFPFVALGVLFNAVFNLHSSVLYVLKRNFDVTLFHTTYIALFAASAYWLVPRYGVIGYGWAEIVGLLAYGVIHLLTVKQVGSPNYTLAAFWGLPCALALFTHFLGPLALLPLAIIAVLPYTRQTLKKYLGQMRLRHG